VRSFLSGCGVRLIAEQRTELVAEIGGAVARQYAAVGGGMLDTVRKNEEAIRRYGSKRIDGAAAVTPSDADKVCAQLFLDVGAFGAQLGELGVDAVSLADFAALSDVVRPSVISSSPQSIQVEAGGEQY